ncbi:MAG: hypothetical protein H0V15_01770 [Solirubrobacterales bacterium]|nr:hypothetical protein [Solirubrobacterales bacterium]
MSSGSSSADRSRRLGQPPRLTERLRPERLVVPTRFQRYVDRRMATSAGWANMGAEKIRRARSGEPAA